MTTTKTSRTARTTTTTTPAAETPVRATIKGLGYRVGDTARLMVFQGRVGTDPKANIGLFSATDVVIGARNGSTVLTFTTLDGVELATQGGVATKVWGIPAADAVEVAPSLGGATETPAAPAQVRRARKAIADATSIATLTDALVDASAVLDALAAPAAAVKAPRVRESLPNAMRRNETTHVDGAEAVAGFTCEAPGCGSVPGVRCLAATGKETSYVHGSRMRQMDLARKYGGTVEAPAAAAPARKGRKGRDADLVFVPGVGTVLPAAPARRTRKGAK